MTMQWHFEDRHFAGEGDIGILQLRGYLGEDMLEKFSGAVDWALARSRGPIVLDLAPLLGLSDRGRTAVWDAAHRVRDRDRLVSICTPHNIGDAPVPAAGEENNSAAAPARRVSVHDDLTSALAAVTVVATSGLTVREQTQ